ncbi:MAG TPA: ATP-binding protein, partial [Planctomycetota bacterium]|nr:ATP-binding protein [Planctomycetota bacterium]
QLKDEFLATLSHELRTPLTPILGWVQILRRSGTGNAQVLQAAEVIERNVRAQTQIVSDLLDMSRIISGKVRLELAPTDLVDVIRAAVDTVEPTAAARGVHVLTSLDPDTGKVRADPNRLQQVVWNLLSNAIKFTPAGGRVQVALRREQESALIIVDDTGQGIAPEFLPHVFERFRQADSSSTREHGGLGIGLALVRQLVEMHAGSVRVESPGRDRGTTFTVEVPLLGQEPQHMSLRASLPVAPESTEPGPRADALLGLRVLVVEDEDDTRQMFARMLGAAGAEVTAVGSAREAMREFERQPPDLLLSDIGMPETDGYWLIQTVRQLPPGAGGAVPAIAVTAFARGSDRSRALGAGYQMHLAKPVGQAELVGAIAGL